MSVDRLTELLLVEWIRHRQTRREPVSEGWQRVDDGYRVIVGTRLAERALRKNWDRVVGVRDG